MESRDVRVRPESTIEPEVTGHQWAPDRAHAYSAWVTFAQHAEATSWNRFYDFLMFNTILILAWSTIYSQTNCPGCSAIVMALMAFVGLISGPVWSALGYRGRKYVDLFLEGGAAIDQDAGHGCQVCKRSLETRNEFGWRLFSSRYILTIAPLVLSALYFVLLIASVVQ